MLKSRLLATPAIIAILGGGLPSVMAAESAWTHAGADKSHTRYSPLSQINARNVGQLQVVWTRPGVDKQYLAPFPDLNPSPYLRGTPIFINGVLYAPNALGLVEAFDPATGQTKWLQQPMPMSMQDAAGQGPRGVVYWRDGDDERIITVRGEFIYALDAKTGRPVPGFGERSRVHVGWPANNLAGYRQSAAPIISNDVIIIGGNGGGIRGGGNDSGLNRDAYSEDVRGYDVRTGKLLWTFHTIPTEGEPGVETWGKESWRYSGAGGSWGGLTTDEELGLVYVPLSAPTVAYYGGHRPGNNLYTNSLVALDARTGKLRWHYQTVHHDLWDYELASPPILGDVTVNGKVVKAVMQASKTGFLFVFDRASGAPVWPIEERPVPQSTTPGEQTSPTQPIPAKLPPFDRQGVTEADLMDFTPALRKEAQDVANQYILGPMFAPASIIDPAPGGKKGTLVVPGVWGSGNWNTGAFDPDTGTYFAVSRTEANVYGLTKVDPQNTMSLEYTVLRPTGPSPNQAQTAAILAASTPPGGQQANASGQQPSLPLPPVLPSGLPILKPPYGRVTAYDIGKGEVRWTAPNGDDPAIRNHPALKGVKLPALLGNAGRAAPLVTKTLFFLADASDAVGGRAGIARGAKLRAYDKATGRVVATLDIPNDVGSTSGPMSYEVDGKQYIVLPVGGAGPGPSWVAYALR